MYIIREIFHLQFGRYNEAKTLIDEGNAKTFIAATFRKHILTDFIGERYHFIIGLPYATLARL